MSNNIISTVNPATEEILAEYVMADKSFVSTVIKRSKNVFNKDHWKNNFHERRDLLF